MSRMEYLSFSSSFFPRSASAAPPFVEAVVDFNCCCSFTISSLCCFLQQRLTSWKARCVDKSCRTCQLANVYLGGLTDVCTTNVSHWIAPSEGAEQKGLLSPQTSLRLQKTRVFRPGLLEIVSSFQAACSARNFSFQLSSDGLGPAELLLQGFMLFHGFCRGLRKRQGRTLVVFSRARLCLLQRFLRAVSEHDGLVR